MREPRCEGFESPTIHLGVFGIDGGNIGRGFESPHFHPGLANSPRRGWRLDHSQCSEWGDVSLWAGSILLDGVAAWADEQEAGAEGLRVDIPVFWEDRVDEIKIHVDPFS